jgi:aminoglycoside 3-N-acetyltransferase
LSLARLKQRLKTVRGRLREGYVRRFRSFTPADLLAMLRDLGVAPGDVVMAHSSFDRFEGFQGSPIDAIKVLKDAVTPEGTLLMVTLPFTGSATDYVKKGEITDLKRTPSRMGLLTEFFRRMGGVERSIHPTHPVAAWGRLAVKMTEGHERARTPCGAPSPFSKLSDENGKILLLGTGVRTITFFHYVEEVIEHMMPKSAFTKEEFTLETRTKTGELVKTVTRLYDQDLALRRWLVPVETELRRRGQWKVGRVKGLVATLMLARDFQQAQTDLAAKGIFNYSEKPRPGAAADPE